MPITKNGSGQIVYSPKSDRFKTEITGTHPADSHAICDNLDPTKQVQFDPSTQALNSNVVFKTQNPTPNSTVTITFPNTNTTLVSNASNSFAIVQADSGTSPTAVTPTDTLTLHSANNLLSTSGNASTDTVTFTVNQANIVIAESQVTNLTTDLAAKQPLATSLTAIAALAGNGIVAQTGANTFANRTITGTTNHVNVSNGDGVSGAPILDLPARITDGEAIFSFNNHGSVLNTGAQKAYVRITYDCTITGWEIVLDQSGSIQFDVWVQTYASFPPTVSNTITDSQKPIVSSAVKATSSTVSGWTTALTKGSYIEINIDSVSAATLAILTLIVSR